MKPPSGTNSAMGRRRICSDLALVLQEATTQLNFNLERDSPPNLDLPALCMLKANPLHATSLALALGHTPSCVPAAFYVENNLHLQMEKMIQAGNLETGDLVLLGAVEDQPSF